MKKNNYDIEPIISEEDFKKNQIRIRNIEKLNKKQSENQILKELLVSILFVLLFVVLLIVTYLSFEEFNKKTSECDLDRGYTCSYYETRQYILGK